MVTRTRTKVDAIYNCDGEIIDGKCFMNCEPPLKIDSQDKNKCIDIKEKEKITDLNQYCFDDEIFFENKCYKKKCEDKKDFIKKITGETDYSKCVDQNFIEYNRSFYEPERLTKMINGKYTQLYCDEGFVLSDVIIPNTTKFEKKCVQDLTEMEKLYTKNLDTGNYVEKCPNGFHIRNDGIIGSNLRGCYPDICKERKEVVKQYVCPPGFEYDSQQEICINSSGLAADREYKFPDDCSQFGNNYVFESNDSNLIRKYCVRKECVIQPGQNNTIKKDPELVWECNPDFNGNKYIYNTQWNKCIREDKMNDFINPKTKDAKAFLTCDIPYHLNGVNIKGVNLDEIKLINDKCYKPCDWITSTTKFIGDFEFKVKDNDETKCLRKQTTPNNFTELNCRNENLPYNNFCYLNKCDTDYTSINNSLECKKYTDRVFKDVEVKCPENYDLKDNKCIFKHCPIGSYLQNPDDEDCIVYDFPRQVIENNTFTTVNIKNKCPDNYFTNPLDSNKCIKKESIYSLFVTFAIIYILVILFYYI